MKSTIALSSEMNDMRQCTDELTAQIRSKLHFGLQSFGILFCDADVDAAALSGILHEKLGIDILGLTTTATIERRSGYNDMGVVLSVVTGDDITFATGTTGDLSPHNYAEKIHSAYTQAQSTLGESPKLILLMAPFCSDITSDKYVFELTRASGGAPVFGGVATDHYDLQYQKTFLNGTSYERGAVFLLLGGNIRPVFAMKHNFGTTLERKGIITQSEGNQVLRVGNQTFKEFLSTFGPVPNERNVIFHFQSTPFVLELPDYTEDEEPVVRALLTIDHDTQAGGFLSDMPENTSISLNVLQKENVFSSCGSTIEMIADQIREVRDYSYSLLLISTCNARHLLMGDDKSVEARIITDKLRDFSENLSAVGFYGFGEICPTAINPCGNAKNRFHNCSIAVCAI